MNKPKNVFSIIKSQSRDTLRLQATKKVCKGWERGDFDKFFLNKLSEIC